MALTTLKEKTRLIYIRIYKNQRVYISIDKNQRRKCRLASAK